MISNNIKVLMKENNYTQKELATRSGCSIWSISRYINNVYTPGIKAMRRIAIALGVTADELKNKNFSERRKI